VVRSALLAALLAPVAVLAAPAAVAAPVVQLVAEPPTLFAGQTGTLHVMVVSEGAGQAQAARGATPSIEVPEGIDLRYRGNGSRFSADGTRIVSITTYQYALDALQAGSWEIGPAKIRLDDGTVADTAPVKVEVKARSAEQGMTADIQIAAAFDVGEAWEGQLVLYQYKLVTSLPGVRAGWRLPEFDGLRQPQRGTPVEQTYEVLDGTTTITTVQGTVPLIATGTGDLSVPPAIATLDIPTGKGGFRGWGGLRQERRATESAELTVRPLPTPPADFSGLVGEVVVEARLETDKAAVGESVGLVVSIRSDGSLEGVTLPPYDADKVSVYDDAQRIDGRVTEQGYRGAAEIRRVLVPVEPGDLELPPVELVTFSPRRGRYVTHEVPLGTLAVTPGREGTGEIQSYAQEPDAVSEVEVVELRGPWTWGFGSTPRLGLAVPLLLLLAAAPGGLVFMGHGAAALRRRYKSWTERDKGPPSPFAHLRSMPTDTGGRLRAYDNALRQALANRQGVPIHRLDRDAVLESLPDAVAKDVRSLQRGLDSVRYGDVPVPDQIDDVVRRVVGAVEAS